MSRARSSERSATPINFPLLTLAATATRYSPNEPTPTKPRLTIIKETSKCVRYRGQCLGDEKIDARFVGAAQWPKHVRGDPGSGVDHKANLEVEVRWRQKGCLVGATVSTNKVGERLPVSGNAFNLDYAGLLVRNCFHYLVHTASLLCTRACF